MTPLLPLLLLCLLLPVTAAAAASLPADFTALLAAKAALSDPASALAAWDPSLSLSLCRWPYVLCRSPGDPSVASLLLSNLSLAGEFPTQLCSLRSLSRLDLSYNSLAGPLPACLAALPSLRHLDLAGNAFSGDVPRSYAAGFASLATLSLAGNDLSGEFPAFLANVSSLEELLLAYNPFAPSSLPDAFPDGLPRLRVLWLAGCCLVGQIPSSLGSLRSLVNLDLSTNNLTGEIPESIGRLENLVQIELYKNNLSGRLPGGLGGLKKLRFLDAAMNRLSGEIPADLFLAPRLESLHLYENDLSGPVPSTLERAPALSDLRLFTNRLVGELPPEFGKNCPLKFLDLSDNRISGRIPATLCSAGKLEQLLILNNELAGSIPAELGQCRTLTRVRLPNNRLSGAVPRDIWGLPRLYLLELAGNALSGTVGPTIALAKNLSQLLISDNHFAGVLPAQIGSLTRLVELSAANNGFSGALPASLADLSALARLDLRNNSFSGELPHGVRRWQRLTQLDLAHNRLTGNIPPELGELPVLNSLDLSNNRLTGDVPVQLENLKLSMFNLSNNRLAGNLSPLFSGDIYDDSFLGNPALCRGACPAARRATARRHSLVGSVESVLTIAVAILILGVAWFWYKYRSQSQYKRRGGAEAGGNKWVVTSFHKVEFDEEDLLSCLDDENNVVGTGAAGKVYRAVLANDDVVAVKKLRRVGGAGAARKDKDGMKDTFEAEVATLGRIRHKNIVKLWCCLRSGDRGLLVYEYMTNGSLGDLLHGGKGGLLDWPTRRRIMVDAAEGLSYLHHDCAPPIVHRDVKSNNILLDAEFGAKVADFGVARVIDGSRGPDAVSAIAGSCGYIAPEYSYTLRITEKSDVYSFGVVMLELVTGKRAVGPELGDKDLVRWVRGGVEREGPDSVLDPRLAGESCTCRDEMRRVLGVALLCASSLPINRPSMRSVVKLLLEVSSKTAVVLVEKEPLAIIDEPLYTGATDDLGVMCEHGKPAKKCVAFEGISTRRRFIACVVEGVNNCGLVQWVNEEWTDHLQNALNKLWLVYEDSKHDNRIACLEHSSTLHSITDQKNELRKTYEKLVEDVDNLLAS
ncbi:Receptor-like protein kinase HSL1 [Hordeum vulgare]|nr:Receptor-like protein kinase HSL1 [Hordeum vulgare]